MKRRLIALLLLLWLLLPAMASAEYKLVETDGKRFLLDTETNKVYPVAVEKPAKKTEATKTDTTKSNAGSIKPEPSNTTKGSTAKIDSLDNDPDDNDNASPNTKNTDQRTAAESAKTDKTYDPLWQAETYEKRLFKVGTKLLEANHIQEDIVFLISRKTLLESNNVNAYAIESFGTVTVQSDLLKYFDNDDELAFILGHEIAHIIQRHSTHQVAGNVARAALITVPLTLLGSFGGPQGASLGSRLGSRVSTTFANAHSRMNESEADRIGLQLMEKAGYDDRQALVIAKKIFSDGTRWTINRTHPMGRERIKALSEMVAQAHAQHQQQPTQEVLAAPAVVESKMPEAATKPAPNDKHPETSPAPNSDKTPKPASNSTKP